MDNNQHPREMQTITALLNDVTRFKTAIELWDLQAEMHMIAGLLLSETVVLAWVVAGKDTSLCKFVV